MKDDSHHRRSVLLHRAPLATVAALIVALASGPAAHANPAASAAAQPETLTATVRVVDPGAGSLDLLTGVGHALRVRRVQLPPETKMLVGRRASPVSGLTPGSIVRVVCRQTAAGTVASSVVLIQPAQRGKP